MTKSTAKLKEKKQVANFVWEFTFELVEPHKLYFEAGQYVAIIVDPKTRRQYSIASSSLSSEKEFILCVDIKPNGLGVNHLLALNIDDEISFIGPIGNFVMPKMLSTNLFFIATGTGIAPLRSMIETLIIKGLSKKHNIHLHFGTRNINDLFYTDLFDSYLRDGSIKEYTKYLSKESLPETISGYVTQFIPNLSSEIISDSQYFICGGTEMVKSAEAMLLEKGVLSSNIFHEKFY